jgi:ribose transport system permease protein
MASASPMRQLLSAHRGVLIAAIVFVVLLAMVDLISAGPLTYFDITFLSSGGATSAIAAMGQTIVILSGGFDLSAGAVISLVNVVLARSMDPMDMEANVLLWTCVGIGIGMLTGAFNGFFIAFLRLQPIVVTLSTMFIIQGVTLLVMDKPGGAVSPSLGIFYMGDAITGWLPMPLVVIGAVLLAWCWLKNTRLGTAIYAVGSDPDAAAAVGVRVAFVRFMVYVIAGGCYGLAGVFISAQTGSGDPLVGNPLLLSMFAAVVVGGTRLGGGTRWTAGQCGRCLHPDDRREHSAGAECFGLLLDHRRGCHPHSCCVGRVDFAAVGSGKTASHVGHAVPCKTGRNTGFTAAPR